jgi:phosphoglucosamine mutase
MELFGTDGIRGLANTHPMTPEMAVRVGRATVHYFREKENDPHPRIIVGRDTRISGPMLQAAVSAGICSMGGAVVNAGVMPTPGVAYLTRIRGASAGIVISASHNPFEDNGIKFFKGDGYKLSEMEEAQLEDLILDDRPALQAQNIKETGFIKHLPGAVRLYRKFLEGVIPRSNALSGMRLAIDCSNGAVSEIAPDLFRKIGADVIPLAHLPDGVNINDDCGSQYPRHLAQSVVKSDAHAGLAFDGDGDRLIAVDETGDILTGDQIIAVCACFYNENKRLSNKTVVTTVMSNMGLKKAFENEGIRHITCDVGDRYVMQAMRENGAVIGGEASGHIIFHDHHTTGDGMLAALKLLEVMAATGRSLSQLTGIMTVYPQVLKNVSVSSKPDLADVPQIQAAIHSAEKRLAGNGRVLVRYSGTQPMCRVMVEASTDSDAHRYCDEIADVIRSKIGS